MLHLNPKRFFIELNFKKRNDPYTTPTNFSSKLCFQGSYPRREEPRFIDG